MPLFFLQWKWIFVSWTPSQTQARKGLNIDFDQNALNSRPWSCKEINAKASLWLGWNKEPHSEEDWLNLLLLCFRELSGFALGSKSEQMYFWDIDFFVIF